MNFDAGGNSRITALGRTAYLQALDEGWADYRRLHHEGRTARMLFNGARETVASILGVHTDEVWFAPSATEALHSVIGAVGAGRRRVGNKVVATRIERSAVLNALDYFGLERTHVPVDHVGHLDLDVFERSLLDEGTSFTVVQHANHEIATVHPVDELLEKAQRARVPFVIDGTSSLGHIAAPEGRWDALVGNSADWGSGPGIGVLALRQRTRTRAVWPEDQDRWFPGGTQLPAIFAAAVCLQEAVSTQEQRRVEQFEYIDMIRRAVARIPDVEVVGDPIYRLPHAVSFSCLYVDGEALTSELDRLGFAVGSGSACTTATLEPSHVLAELGVLTHGNVRISLDWDVTQQDVERFITVFPQAVASVRAMMGVTGL